MKYITKENPNLNSIRYKVDLTNGNIKILKRPLGEAGDIVLYDKIAKRLFCIYKDSDLSKYPIENYTLVGVVVVPASHNIYGDGSCGVMSLVNMANTNPDNGSIQLDNIKWGGYGVDVNTLSNLNRVSYVGGCDAPGDESSAVVGEYYNACIPSDAFESNGSVVQCPHDLNAYYYYNNSGYYAVPSPYLTDGSRNPAYYQITSPSSEANALADFNGKQNTQILCNLVTRQPDWKTAYAIIDSGDEGYYPAACCCWRFHTEGTEQGDWYLPAAGELGYVCARLKIINDTIRLLITAYGSSVGSSVSNVSYCSSSEYNGNSNRNVDFNDGYLNANVKHGSANYCRAFYRLLIKP